MTGTDGTCAQWLSKAQISEQRLTTAQRGLLQAAFAFRQRCGDDYYSNRLLSHFLLHCNSGLKVAQIARLVGVSRPTASHQQALSSKEAIQAAHHRLAGRAYGKLLPRYAGPIAEFILSHPEATRYDVPDRQRFWGGRTVDIGTAGDPKERAMIHRSNNPCDTEVDHGRTGVAASPRLCHYLFTYSPGTLRPVHRLARRLSRRKSASFSA